MPNVSAMITFDNDPQSGDLSLSQISAEIAAANGGNPPGAADIVRDVNGKLIRVQLSMPDTVKQQAEDAINANPGVPFTTLPFPAQQFADDLLDSGGIVYSGGEDLRVKKMNFQVSGRIPPSTGVQTLGTLAGRLASQAAGDYSDGVELASAEGIEISCNNQSADLPAEDFVLNSGDITLHFSATLSLPLLLTAPITFLSNGQSSQMIFYIDVNGNLLQRKTFNVQGFTNVNDYGEYADVANTFGVL